MAEATDLLDPSIFAAYPEIAETQRLLGEMANLIQQVEARYARNPSIRLQSLIEAHAPETRGILDALGKALNNLVGADPAPDVLDQVRAMVSGQVGDWSRTSPLFHHIYNTPRHKLGPYEVFDLLLAKRPGGADVAGQILDHYYMNTAAATAFCLRNETLTRRLAAEIEHRAAEHRPVRLLNLHTGSGHELQILSAERSLRAVIQVTCLDTDASALRRVKQHLTPQLADNVTFQFGDPRKIVQSRTWPDAPYDLVYALNLFDQLSEPEVAPLIAGAYRGLRPGGKLIFGNFATSMPAHEHTLIHWVLNLNLRWRDKTALRDIFAHTPFDPRAIAYELDPPGVSWLIIAERL